MSEAMTPERALRSLEMAILPDPHDEREISGPWLEKKIREVLPILRAALPRWIPVEERLPEINTNVIAWGEGWAKPREMRWTSNAYAKTERGRAPRWEESDGRLPWAGAPTRWMPLPAPPTQEEQE